MTGVQTCALPISSAGALWARVSAQVYNEPADYDGVVGFIDREPPGSA